ncbi:MAG: DUF2997 domain-containing protein [Methanoregulaceae archaeon]|jgi:hypothetical protein|nr:DUF2997 domain-containing protein [Methanoregulaceae archaeon]MCU0628535.1 DUF2997 domain-containing protein [Methanoregulaceae archaeon]
MDIQELEIQVDRDGNVTVHVKGVKGDECVALTKSIEDALGRVADRSLTHEHYENLLKECTRFKVRES